jgi:hypothetical protein
MPAQYWVAQLNTNVNNNVSATNAAVTTIIDVSPAPQLTLPANFLTVGSTLRLTAYGAYTSSASAGTFVIGFYYGAVAGIALAATAATSYTASQTGAPWRAEYTGAVRTVGSSGTIFGEGFVLLGTAPGTYGSPVPMPGTNPAAVTIDTTTAKSITVGFTSSASQSVTVNGLLVESMA